MASRSGLLLAFLLALIFLAFAAPASAQTDAPPPTATPVPPVPPGDFQDFWIWLNAAWATYRLWLILFLVLAALIGLIWAIVKSASNEGGKQLGGWLASRFHRYPNPIRQYLQWFVAQYQDPKFSALSLGLYEERKPATLKDVYLPIEVNFELTEQERAARGKDSRRGRHLPEMVVPELGEREQSIGLDEALRRSHVLTIEGIPGSGKSTLLQWIGLNCAQALLKQEIPGQKALLKAMGGPLFPIFIPLGAFDRFCARENRERSAAAMLDFVADWYKKHYEPQKSKSAVPQVPDEFFASKIKNGCLFLFDGVDEVAPGCRLAVRRAVHEMLTIHAHPRTRAIITARPSASAEAQTASARHGRVLPLDDPKRDQLIRNLYRCYDPANAERRSSDLIARLDASDERVRRLAETPLLTTIFTIIHRPGHELPHQRSEVYDSAVETLLRDLHRKDPHETGLGETDAAELRSRIALIAFQLHLAGVGEEGKAEDDLIDLLLGGFSTTASDPVSRREEIRNFLYAVAMRGGLLEEQDRAFAFRTHRTFQEFLAGWHLVTNYAPFDLEKQAGFVREHLTDDWWVEPVRLAAGYLAVRGENQAKAFVAKLAELGQSEDECDRAVALAGLSLADLPAQSAYRDLRENLPGKMLTVIERNPPTLPLRLRRELGLALSSLKDPANPKRLFDPRLHPGGMPALSQVIPAGPFRMGTNAADEEVLKAQGVEERYIWENEKTGGQDLIVEISYDYQVGKYPVTNAEYRAFVEAKGYGELDGEPPPWWSETGWQWRVGLWDTQDFSMFTEDYQERLREWLARRPKEKRGQPFWWEDPKWNAANLPVVGVSWFEAEAYANWLTDSLRRAGQLPENQAFRLPSEAEWEKAARGEKGFLWPWGNAWDASKCNNDEPEDKIGSTSPVGIYPHGASPCGALDMAGNVWEWCLDEYSQEAYSQWLKTQAVDPRGPAGSGLRVVRGGSWDDVRSLARCAYRYRNIPVNFNYNVGFRLVLSPI